MRLKQYITELSMKSDTTIKVDQNNSEIYSATIEISVEDRLATPESDRTFYFEAFTDNPFKIERMYKDNNLDYVTSDTIVWEIVFKDARGRLELSPKTPEIALKLFAALEKITEQFIRVKKPRTLIFTSQSGEASRVKLYDLLAKKIKRKGKYEIYNLELSGTKTYMLTKIKKKRK